LHSEPPGWGTSALNFTTQRKDPPERAKSYVFFGLPPFFPFSRAAIAFFFERMVPSATALGFLFFIALSDNFERVLVYNAPTLVANVATRSPFFVSWLYFFTFRIAWEKTVAARGVPTKALPSVFILWLVSNVVHKY
jgi:hypothetical protein